MCMPPLSRRLPRTVLSLEQNLAVYLYFILFYRTCASTIIELNLDEIRGYLMPPVAARRVVSSAIAPIKAEVIERPNGSKFGFHSRKVNE